MEKKKFSLAERYSVWKVLGPNCRWCKTPVEYADCHIDHIIPEYLLEHDEERKTVLTRYGLDESFELNSFNNWIPVHMSCNLSKQKQVVEGAPIFLELLEEVRLNAKVVETVCKKWQGQNKTAKLISLIERDARTGLIDKTTVTRIFASINDDLTPIAGLTGSTISNKIFYVPATDVWQVTNSDNGFYSVSKDGMTGITPIEPALDPSWLCSSCKNYGPWDGNRCLNCGQYSYD